VCHIAVGSPGRLCGLITSGALLVGTVKSVVLDEADQLLSEGFYADTAWLLQQLPKRKQVLAFSATYTAELLADLEPLMRRPQKVCVLTYQCVCGVACAVASSEAAVCVSLCVMHMPCW
jgi:ATP-dependent RNA helicase DDX20